MFDAWIERTALYNGINVGTEARVFYIVDQSDHFSVSELEGLLATRGDQNTFGEIPCTENDYNGWIGESRVVSDQLHYDYLKRHFMTGDGKCPNMFFFGNGELETCQESDKEHARLVCNAQTFRDTTYVCRFWCDLEHVWSVLCIENRDTAMKERLKNQYKHFEYYDGFWEYMVHEPKLFR